MAALLRAVAADPDDLALRCHVAQVLLDGGHPAQALVHVAAVLAGEPTNSVAQGLLQRASTALAVPGQPPPEESAPSGAGFDWSAAEQDLGPVDHPFSQPLFADRSGSVDSSGPVADPLSAYEIEATTLRLSDVGGMGEVKKRLDLAFLTPMRHPELRQAFGKSLRGGLLLYGPPGCGKTFIARALAGELGARFATVSLADVLDMWIGQSERNVQALFAAARAAAPCVLFLDEVDALGHKRSQMRGSAQRGSVNQLLTELDGVGSANDGVFVLAATNAPWDVDPALRRPGRFDRMVLVLPPDEEARAAILRSYLAQRPIAGVDVGRLVRRTEHFSGADLAHLVDSAAERALAASVASGEVRPITDGELDAALKEIHPSTGPWFSTARNVAEFANAHGEYDDLLAYLKRRKLL